ncbi:MAG: hypothetical protein IJ087_17340 [Eggerthellaceae bacterium]|nr:hypothetical protein [Eggerthellaceae bacterium]
MEEKDHGSEEAQDAQREDRAQEPQEKPVDVGADASAYEAQIAERDSRIKELEAQVAEAAKTAEATETLKSQIEELKAQGESDRIEFELRLAGVRNVKAARAILDEHGGDVAALKEAEPWLFADAAHKQSGKTGLPNAGTSSDEGKTMKRWRKLAGLDDSGDE